MNDGTNMELETERDKAHVLLDELSEVGTVKAIRQMEYIIFMEKKKAALSAANTKSGKAE